ncbi:MAG: hypothetical protein SFZ03_11880 [Candidatus Melainabacteria bacterium]|nr:hypothetical protein [Candidatus Melainabacteria bacterium]
MLPTQYTSTGLYLPKRSTTPRQTAGMSESSASSLAGSTGLTQLRFSGNQTSQHADADEKAPKRFQDKEGFWERNFSFDGPLQIAGSLGSIGCAIAAPFTLGLSLGGLIVTTWMTRAGNDRAAEQEKKADEAAAAEAAKKAKAAEASGAKTAQGNSVTGSSATAVPPVLEEALTKLSQCADKFQSGNFFGGLYASLDLATYARNHWQELSEATGGSFETILNSAMKLDFESFGRQLEGLQNQYFPDGKTPKPQSAS